MKTHSSLQHRLGIRLTVLLTSLWLLATGLTAVFIRHEINEAFDLTLRNTATQLLAGISALPEASETTAQFRLGESPHESAIAFALRGPDGTVLKSSDQALEHMLAADISPGYTTQGEWRIFAAVAGNSGHLALTAEPLRHRHTDTLESGMVLLAPLLLMLPASLFGIWWQVRRALRPLSDVEDQLRERGADHLRALSASGLPEELVPIIDSVNRLMERLRRALDAERHFTMNSAHELRTPLARALAQTQRLHASTDDASQRERIEELERTLHQLINQSEKLLQLARADGACFLGKESRSVIPILRHLVDEYERASDTAGRLQYEEEPGATFMSRIDTDSFGILLRNLVENALRHSPAGSTVWITVEKDRLVRIRNTGPALPAELLERLPRRFVRGVTDVPGSGLGLAIACTIAERSGAELLLRSPIPGQHEGFEALLRLNV